MNMNPYVMEMEARQKQWEMATGIRSPKSSVLRSTTEYEAGSPLRLPLRPVRNPSPRTSSPTAPGTATWSFSSFTGDDVPKAVTANLGGVSADMVSGTESLR